MLFLATEQDPWPSTSRWCAIRYDKIRYDNEYLACSKTLTGIASFVYHTE